ncbi:hypothetical protein L914_13377 [Phytophthora nicotianae]|uniref:Uncharacterized protein n=1 Tax=Phytophthora nicotianae TaxID=4792 RepID=W2MWX2_PHYNI|nr:hypothetical protein L914_13377 [Phytophthora nicotianae]
MPKELKGLFGHHRSVKMLQKHATAIAKVDELLCFEDAHESNGKHKDDHDDDDSQHDDTGVAIGIVGYRGGGTIAMLAIAEMERSHRRHWLDEVVPFYLAQLLCSCDEGSDRSLCRLPVAR